MTYVDQHKMVEALKGLTHRMKGRDAYDFEMFVKRDKDDETLDSLSLKRLQDLYERYAGKHR
ncbi:MAG TPA: hypothetical protein VIH68_06030 [Bacteroidota bacterium]